MRLAKKLARRLPARKGAARMRIALHSSERTREELELQNESLRQAQLELEAFRDSYADLLDTAPICFVTLTRSGVIRDINLRGLRLLSSHHRRLTGWPFVAFIAYSDKKVFLAHLSRCRDNSDPTRPLSVELQLARPAGEPPVFIELVSIPARERGSRQIVFKNVFRDITELKQMQKANRWLAAIVESSDDAIIGKDMEGKIISCNRGAERLFGYACGELIGKPMSVLCPPDARDEEPRIMEQLRRGKKIEHYETIRWHKQGFPIPVSLTISPIRDEHGSIIGISNIAHDISQRKNAEKRLEESLLREKKANRAKDDFLAALSHELRTPLNPVLLLASDGARNAEFTPQARMDFDTIQKNIELEARLIDDMLDLTRITRGKLSLEMKLVDVRAALQDAMATVQADVEQKKIGLEMNLKAEKQIILGDAVRLRQIFWNILKNAVKFTPAGGSISVETRNLAEVKLLVVITDSGIGIEPDELPRIFGAFAQGTHHFGGLGLGLAISRALVEMHSGSIRVESPGRGKGATFFVELPVAQVEKSETAATVSPADAPAKKISRKGISGKGIHILLVEDHEPTRIGLTHLLLRRNYQVTSVGSLSEARAAVEKENVQLLISDIGLPDGNGCDLMEEMGKRFHVKGIALTGYGMENDVNRSYGAGFSAHLTKPVRIESLDEALTVAMRGESRSNASIL